MLEKLAAEEAGATQTSDNVNYNDEASARSVEDAHETKTSEGVLDELLELQDKVHEQQDRKQGGRRRGVRQTLTTLVTLCALSACESGTSGDFGKALERAAGPPPATAAPSPSFESDVTLPPLPESTQSAPEATSTTAPMPIEPPRNYGGLSPTTAPAEIKPRYESLPTAERQAIVDATGYEGLSNPDVRLEVIERDGLKGIVIISVNGAESTVPIAELISYLNAAEEIAAERPSITSRLQLGPQTNMDVTFDIKPANLTPATPDTHYFLMTGAGEDLAALAAPVDVSAFPGAAFTFKLPYQDMSVTLLKDMGKGTLRDVLPANSSDAAVEAFQSKFHIDLSAASRAKLDTERPDVSYLHVPGIGNLSEGRTHQARMAALTQLGQEIAALSYGHAAVAEGLYEQYAVSAGSIELRSPLYSQTDARYYVLSPTQFIQLHQKLRGN